MPGPEVIIIKKKPKGHAAHSAAWKVAYADFVTAMMALFMVLWLVSQTDQSMKKSISDYFRTGAFFAGAPSVLAGGSGIADRGFLDVAGTPAPVEPVVLQRRIEMVRNSVDQALDRPRLKGLTENVFVKATDEGILIQIADDREDLLFDLSSSELKPSLTELLAALAPTLSEVGYQLELHGHTDARPFPEGSARNNWTLSFERAERARAELVKGGVPAELIRGVYAHGSTVLADPEDPKSARNRRLAIFARRVVALSSAPPDVPRLGEPGTTQPEGAARSGKLGAVGPTHAPESSRVAAHGREGDLRQD